jgi:uncharacterized damage-inducible protein DinB
MTRRFCLMVVVAALCAPAFAQNDPAAMFVKHLKISRDFTLKVANAMPEASFDFKLTPPQMSFADQIVHLAQGCEYFMGPILGHEPKPGKPASMKKADVMAFVKQSYDATIEQVSKLTAAQLAKSYKGGEGDATGTELLIGLLDHCTHHRASAEMYLRAKGITPPEYQF